MKKIILSTFSFILAMSASAQIEIYHGENEIDISGTTVDVVIDESIVYPGGETIWEEHFVVKNLTGTDGEWRIRRVKVDVPAYWNDQVCWPPSCYPTNNQESFTTPLSQAPTVTNGTTDAVTPNDGTFLAEIKPGVTPDFDTPSSATYKYYISEKNTGALLDSVTVRYSYGNVGIETEAKVELSIAPNPANEYVTITIEGTDAATVKMVDLLGNVVYNKQLNATTKLSLADFKNGVYFVTIDSGSKKSITKKLIIRH